MNKQIENKLVELTGNSIEIQGTDVKVIDPSVFRENIYKLIKLSAFGISEEKAWARYIIRTAGLELGVIPASIHDLYIARGEGRVPNTFTVPAINLRVLTFQAAKTVFKVAMKMNANAILFEIARSEIGYTNQRPSEYSASIIAAAISADYTGPVFIQGDHFQISPSRYFENSLSEVDTVKELSAEAIQAGFYNLDVDTSTLVDMEKESIIAQQDVNTSLSAEISAYIRSQEPENVTISIGGEIGEVGGHNSTEPELRAYVDGYISKLKALDPEAIGLSKISIQTGTSHGGVVLPDGTIASVSVDFDTLYDLSKITREEYKMGGAVQHGASTLPQEAFGKFVEAEAIEVHLATNFQNIFYDHAPESLINDIISFLNENYPNERKEGMTDDQFFYKARKRAFGEFKKEIMNLPEEIIANITDAWEIQFTQLFTSLAIENTRDYVNEFVAVPKVKPNLENYLKIFLGETIEEDVSDLAD